ncbi:hypothetical protein LPE509_01581 [Legionella pneumophila subsp. pneumophila LPE509]|nr:hypothetical protein LPE509_01581 [Legionella pneumophila subsp. pneumophila LPE509]
MVLNCFLRSDSVYALFAIIILSCFSIELGAPKQHAESNTRLIT